GNVLSDVTGAFAKSTSLVVGGPSTGVGSNGSTGPVAIGGTTGTLILNTAQNYTGLTLVNTGSVLEFRGAMSTSAYEIFGALAALHLRPLGGNQRRHLQPQCGRHALGRADQRRPARH